jgi:hypothetical protein
LLSRAGGGGEGLTSYRYLFRNCYFVVGQFEMPFSWLSATRATGS